MAVVTHWPIHPRPHGVVWLPDKAIHFSLFFVLAVLGEAAARLGGVHRTARAMAVWVAVYAAYGALDECLQPLTGRSADVKDWLADVLGILAGLTVWVGIWRLRRAASRM